MLVGWCMPAGTDRRRVAALSLLVQAMGCGTLVLSGSSDVALLLLGIVLIGSGIGNATSLPPLIAQVEFTRADAPRIVALTVAISQAAYAFAPGLFGLLRQVGSDRVIFLAAAAIQLAAISAYLAGRGAGGPRRGEIGSPVHASG